MWPVSHCLTNPCYVKQNSLPFERSLHKHVCTFQTFRSPPVVALIAKLPTMPDRSMNHDTFGQLFYITSPIRLYEPKHHWGPFGQPNSDHQFGPSWRTLEVSPSVSADAIALGQTKVTMIFSPIYDAPYYLSFFDWEIIQVHIQDDFFEESCTTERTITEFLCSSYVIRNGRMPTLVFYSNKVVCYKMNVYHHFLNECLPPIFSMNKVVCSRANAYHHFFFEENKVVCSKMNTCQQLFF